MISTEFPNDEWTRVEVFRLVYGHLPSHSSDTITEKTLKQFCIKALHHEITSETIDVLTVAHAILEGRFLTSAELAKEEGQERKAND